MRVSADYKDEGFLPPSVTGKLEVLFNGEVQSLSSTGRAIITADEEAGIIICSKSANGTGLPLIVTNGRIQEFTERGTVVVQRKDA